MEDPNKQRQRIDRGAIKNPKPPVHDMLKSILERKAAAAAEVNGKGVSMAQRQEIPQMSRTQRPKSEDKF